jgi:ribosomal protein L17
MATIATRVIDIFTDSQHSEASHRNGVLKLLKLSKSTDESSKSTSTSPQKLIQSCYDKILSYSKKDTVAENVMRFYSLFVSQLITAVTDSGGVSAHRHELFTQHILYL